MKYEQALKTAQKIGASRADGKILLALLCQSLAYVHAINPALVYEGAIKQRIDSRALARLAETDPVALGNLMFV